MKITLFIPCLTDLLFPETGMNTVRVLERLGHEVCYDARQTCCGQPTFNAGYLSEAKVLAMRFLDLFHGDEYIVAPSGSCVTMAKVFYAEMLSLPTQYHEKALSLRTRIFELTEFLIDVLKVEDVGAEFNGRVTVHDSCHALRELKVSEAPRKLLRNVRGLELIEMRNADTCCGFGGTFAVKHANISSAMDEEKVSAIIEAGVDVVTAVDSSCLMHIDGMLKRKKTQTRAVHIADILAGKGNN